MANIESGNLVPTSGKSFHSPFPISHFLSAALIGAALTGCGTQALLQGLPPTYISEGNHLTFEHAFTEAAAEAVRRRAESHCADKKEAAVRTSGTCSLTRCTTHYQCMSQAEAAAYRPEGPRMKDEGGRMK